jgi:hypothetical protein
MKITTLLAYWTDQKTQADMELSDARADLTKSQTELAVQRANLTKANQELAALVTQSKKIHGDLAEAVTTADAHAIESNLAKNISDTRTKQAEIIGIEAAIDTAQTTLNLANATVNAATTRVSTVGVALEAADQNKDRVNVGAGQAVRTDNFVKISGLTDHPFIINDPITVMGMKDESFDGTFTISAVDKDNASITYSQKAANATSGGGVLFGKRALRLRQKLKEPPLSTLKAEADNIPTGESWNAAKKRLEEDITRELFTCTEARADLEIERLNNYKKQADKLAEQLDVTIKINNLSQKFEKADAAFRDYVVNAKRRFDQVQAIAARVADTKQNQLTEAEKASIQSKKPDDGTNDAVLQEIRKTAANRGKALATAQKDFDIQVINAEEKKADAEINLLKAQRIALAKDINPGADEEVKKAKTELETAKNELENLKTNLPEKLKKSIEEFSLFETNDKDPDEQDLKTLVDKLEANSGPAKLVSQFIWGKFDKPTKDVLGDSTAKLSDQQDALIEALNKILKGESIYEEQRFKGVDLHPATQLLIKNPTTENRIRLNRLLLEDTYPLEIANSHLFKPFYQVVLWNWELAVPDTAWRNLADFEEAKRLLTDLQMDPAQLVKTLDEAEADFVASLQEEDKNRKKLESIKDEMEKAATKLSFETGILPRRVFSALRGDS